MSIELKIPDVGESVREVQIGRWLKKEGDTVSQDEDLVELETDKASLELPAPEAGVLVEILKQEGDTVAVGEVVGYLEKNGAAAGEVRPKEPKDQQPVGKELEEPPQEESDAREADGTEDANVPTTPAARRALREYKLEPTDIDAAGERIERDDVLRQVGELEEQEHEEGPTEQPLEATAEEPASEEPSTEQSSLEEAVPMSLIRRSIAQRLVEAQQQAALLTTFNEIDMSAVKESRAEHRERFYEKYGIKLGFMSFFVKAVVDALKQCPKLNAQIRGDKIVYRNYYDVGIAIGSERGLVVPVLRQAERLSFAEIEQAIDDFATRAAKNDLTPKDLEGGTFTITNGGVYGSLLSTPIVNPPQSGVLGMHAIEDRPVARDGQIVIRPMMYVALTYDHRLVDGREAVSFLRRVKEAIEDPARMLLEV